MPLLLNPFLHMLLVVPYLNKHGPLLSAFSLLNLDLALCTSVHNFMHLLSLLLSQSLIILNMLRCWQIRFPLQDI